MNTVTIIDPQLTTVRMLPISTVGDWTKGLKPLRHDHNLPRLLLKRTSANVTAGPDVFARNLDCASLQLIRQNVASSKANFHGMR